MTDEEKRRRKMLLFMETARRLPSSDAEIDELETNCPGEGKCHGPLCWCDICGDVDLVCDSPGCMRHWCSSCGERLGKDDYDGEHWSAMCAVCRIASINDDQIQEYESALERGDWNKADAIARDLADNPTPAIAHDAYKKMWKRWL